MPPHQSCVGVQPLHKKLLPRRSPDFFRRRGRERLRRPGPMRRDRPNSLRRTSMRMQNVAAVVATVAVLSIPTAQAQLDRPVAPPALSQPLKPCPPSVGNNAASNETTGSRTLSDQLSQSKGVICPPAGIDPGISVPPSGGGRTPVIPPPGTPGGDPSIQPK